MDSLEHALAFLAARQNADGGWPYLQGKQSRTEPTCYALLALTAAPDKSSRAAKAIDWFGRQQTPAGAVALEGDPNVIDNWGTLLAFFTLRRLNLGAQLSDGYLRHLLHTRGKLIAKKYYDELKLDGTLNTWPWVLGASDWVEPTAYAVLALKAGGLADHARTKEGEKYLADRACHGGGWNYGNKEVLGVTLAPMPTNTAFALLALQQAPQCRDLIDRSLNYLARELSTRQSTLSLALAALAFDAHGKPCEQLLAALTARQQADGGWRDNTHLTALAALALQTQAERKNVFKV